MKKILITGMNTLQCNMDFYLKQQLQVVPSHYSLVRCLRDMGWEVEQRPVALGEDLSHYDEVVVYIHSIQAFCQYIWSGLYAISARPNCIIAFDDWQFTQIYGAIQTYHDKLVEGDPGVFRDYLIDLWAGKEDKETIEKYRQAYIDGCKVVIEKKNRLLVSAFSGGDMSLLNLGWDQKDIYAYNPNPYHLNRCAENGYGTGVPTTTLSSFFEDEISKEFRWNFASLVQEKTRKWLKLQNPEKWSWPIEYFGAKRGKYKSERKTEPEMVKVFERQWGCLMPGYFHAGSGWWRARPLQVADIGSIIIGDIPEMMVYYKDEALAKLRVADIEAMDVTQLKQTAAAQREAIYANHPLDKMVQQAELKRILEA